MKGERPDFYTTIETCMNVEKIQTNPRYSNFKQYQYTVGDEEQYARCIDTTRVVFDNNINIDKNLYKNAFLGNDWEKYKNTGPDTMMNTFRYVFYKFKKGIFVKIIDNKLKVFIPFSNASYENEWSHNINVDKSKYGNIHNFLKIITELSGYTFNPKRVSNNIKTWYGNNSIVRYEYPVNEGDTNVMTIKNMLKELCDKRKIPDVEFFINRRDFPIITKDSTEPYNNIWGNKTTPLVSHCFDKYLPILSVSNTNRYSDVLFPVYEDWERIQSKHSKYFPPKCRNYQHEFNIEWNDKKSIAVFRGGSTGSGVTIDTNPRLKVAYMSRLCKKDEDGIPFIDAGITNWNLRPRKLEDNEYLQTIDINNIGIDLVDKLTPSEQSRYKYIINIDGHVSAFRLSLEMNMGSVILKVESEWKVWYSQFLKPYVHYVPIKSDLSDLYSQIKWCKNNDNKCKDIVKNAKEFYNTYLQEDGVLDYLQKMLIDIKSKSGNYEYPSKSITDFFIDYEYENIDRTFPYTDKNEIVCIPKLNRSYELLSGIEWSVRKSLSEDTMRKYIKTECVLFSNKLSEVEKGYYSSFPVIIKNTTDEYKTKEHIHEVFIGTRVINKLLSCIPNFMYVMGLYKQDSNLSVISEYIQGETLFEYINSSTFDFKEFLFILIQICLALEVAQNKCGFVHYDLTPWNIMLKRTTVQKIEYKLNYNKVVVIRTTIIPIIIDYGKSHVVYDNVHHGFVNRFKMSTIQDVISLLLSSVSQIISKVRLNQKDFGSLIFISNFISNTTYCPDEFKNANAIRTFFFQARKYTNLTYYSKHELEQYTPIDFINHILKLTNYEFPYFVNKSSTINNSEISRQVFDYIYARTNNERVESFINVLNRIKQRKGVNIKNPIISQYYIQRLQNVINTTTRNLTEFIKQNHLSVDIPVITLTIPDTTIHEETTLNNFKIDEYRVMEQIPYDEFTITSKTKRTELTKHYENKYQKSYIDFIDILHTIKLDRNDVNLYKDVLNIKPCKMITNLSNKNTIKFIYN